MTAVTTPTGISPELRAGFERPLPPPESSVYRMARRNRFMGRWLRHGEGYPDWNLRLFDRKEARWSDDLVHEKVLYAVPPGTLEGDLLHEQIFTTTLPCSGATGNQHSG